MKSKQVPVYKPEYQASGMVSERAAKDPEFMEAMEEMCKIAFEELKKQPKVKKTK